MDKAAVPYSTAKGFCQGAFAMMSNPCRFQLPDDSTFVLPFHHLVGFSVELYLKSFLLSKHFSEESLTRKPYGHNLTNLLSAAKEHAFECAEGEYLVDYLKPHETYDYRYLNRQKEYQTREIHLIFGLLSGLDAYVDTIVGASAAHNRTPGPGWDFPEVMGTWRIPK